MNFVPNFTPKLNRRAFVIGAAATGGLALSLRLPFGPDVVRAADGSPEVNAWVVIRPDDTVVIRIARSEMGQGSLTGLAQLVAEELECDWSKVTTEYPTPGQSLARHRVYGDMSTGGSRGIRTSQQYVREAGAAARTVLIQAAANEWKVPAAECSAANSVITHKPSGRTVTYGKVADAAAKLEAPKGIKLKDPKDWKLIGKGVKRLDTADKLTGKQVYGIDIKMPGMLIATIKDLPGPHRHHQELRRRQGDGHAGRQESRSGRRFRRRGDRRHVFGAPIRRWKRSPSCGIRARPARYRAPRLRNSSRAASMPSRPSSATGRAT